MRPAVFAALVAVLAGVLAAPAAADVSYGMPVLVWSSNQLSGVTCPFGHDFCAEIEFCASGSYYGYRLAQNGPCLTPGPLIRVRAGKNYYITLRNSVSGVTTNLHTHGLHISGSGNGDDVTRSARFEGCLHYSWRIPASHAGGTFWYHAHYHGDTNTQVTKGALGMIVVEEDVGAVLAGVGSTTNPQIGAFLNNDIPLMVGRINNKYIANSAAVTSLTLPIYGKTWYRLRVALSDPSGSGGDLAIGGGCSMHEVAYDGVLSSPLPYSSTSQASVPILTGASRVDVAVKCPDNAAVPVYIRGNQVATIQTSPVGSAFPVAPSPFTATGAQWAPSRPAYLRDLRGASVTGGSLAVSLGGNSINGLSWDPSTYLKQYSLGQVAEWAITRSSTHPFHLHVFHFQIISSCGSHRVGQFYDTITSSGTCTTRILFADIPGRAVLHCHLLTHEDNGMMTQLNIVGGEPQSSTNPSAASEVCSAWETFTA